MTEVRGVLTTLNHALPSGLDAARLAQWQLRDGSDYMTFRSQIAAALDGLNAELMQSWGDLCYVTFDDHFEYPNGGAVSDVPDATDVDTPDGYKGTTIGHMLDLKNKEAAVGGSKKFFRDARQPVLQATIRGHVQRFRQTFEKAILTRAMTNTENQLNSTGYDVPFVKASGTVAYVPMPWNGKTFDTTHSHYIGQDSGSKTRVDTLDELAGTLQEHGHAGPFTALVPQADVKLFRALKGYRQPITERVIVVDRGGETTGNAFYERGTIGGAPNTGTYYIGSYDSPYGEVMLRATARIPTAYALMYKSYGINDERNPIAIRVHPDVGFGIRLIEEPSFDAMYPIKKVNVEFEYGISVGADRTVGASGYLVSGGTWANPTIS